MIPLQIHTFQSVSQIQMFPNSLKLSSHPGNAIGLCSMETVNAPRHHPGHLCRVETGDKVEPSNGKSQSQEPCQLLGSGRGGKWNTAPGSNLPLLSDVQREVLLKFRQFVFSRAPMLQERWFRGKSALFHCLAPEDVSNSSSSSA